MKAVILNNSIWIGTGEEGAVTLPPQNANRHGLISGATGTGKTVTLQVMAESFSALGVPVFLADVKGDLGGLCQSASVGSKIASRLETCGAANLYTPQGFPAVFWDVYGETGHPVRTTVTEMGPLLLSRLLGLNETQSGVLYLVFRIADREGLLLIDLKDLKSVLSYVGENAAAYTVEYGNITKASIGVLQRAVAVLEDQGGDRFFGEPALDINDFFCRDSLDRGVINILQAQKLYLNPVMYSTFLLWLLSSLYEALPEVGDLERPRLVFFFDEAHLLFRDCSKALTDKLEQTVKLIRSKGVGVYFITQSPSDVPTGVLAQLNNRVQHALRAYTPAEQKLIRAVADTFRQNPKIDTADALGKLATGEALVSFLDASGAPCPMQRVTVLPPQSRIGTVTDAERDECMGNDAVGLKYDAVFDRESAYEVLAAGIYGAENGALQPLPGADESAQAIPAAAPAVFKVYDPATGTYVERELLPPQPQYAAPAQQQVVTPVQPQYVAPAQTVHYAPPAYPPTAHPQVRPRSTVRVSSPRVSAPRASASRGKASALDSFARSAINSAGRTLGNTLTRGILDTLGLGRKKRR